MAPSGDGPAGHLAGLVRDLIYLLVALVAAPFWLARMARSGRLPTDWRARLGWVQPLPAKDHRQRVLIHAVSVGELNAVRLFVAELAQRGFDVVVATTTETGIRRARELFGPRHPVVRYPLDFSTSVRRFLRAVEPDAVALVELEVWPNFVAACGAAGVPVAVVNGRLSERSFRRYRWIAPALRRTFGQLAAVAAQDQAYAARFQALGVPIERVVVTGTMKWDTAQCEDRVDGSEALAAAMGIDRSRPLVVAGSTAPEEHELLRQAVPADVQLLVAPRRPEWFDGAEAAFPGCARRSRAVPGSSTGRFVLDTIGELRQAYALADVVVVGRSFVPMGGSDMIEPVGLGRATVVGPHAENFQDSADALERGGGLVRATRDSLGAVLGRLLRSPGERVRLAEAGREIIRSRQGATAQSVAIIERLVQHRAASVATALRAPDSDS